ncbi:MAG: SH3 domain-containing protein, partial [Hyphococcus sp.]
DLDPVMETDLGLYVATRNANVRIGPGTAYAVAEMLDAGAGVEVVGRVVDKSWMLVAVDGVVRGYVFQDLLIKAPGAELELAGGPQRSPRLCRAYAQRLEMEGARDAWKGAACVDGAGWRVLPPTIDPENRPALLTEY